VLEELVFDVLETMLDAIEHAFARETARADTLSGGWIDLACPMAGVPLYIDCVSLPRPTHEVHALIIASVLVGFALFESIATPVSNFNSIWLVGLTFLPVLTKNDDVGPVSVLRKSPLPSCANKCTHLVSAYS